MHLERKKKDYGKLCKIKNKYKVHFYEIIKQIDYSKMGKMGNETTD